MPATAEPLSLPFSEVAENDMAAARATPEFHRTFWQQDIQKWRPLIQAAGQYAD